MAHLSREIVISKAKDVKALVLDVDGVLTDGTILYDSHGEQLQGFNVKDGLGIVTLIKNGIPVAVISSRGSNALKRRIEELGMGPVYTETKDKVQAFDGLLSTLRCQAREVAYVGDDWVDLPLLQRVGLAVAVADAMEPLKDYVHLVTGRPGGRGAVREVCDLILKAKGLWADTVNSFLDQ